MSATPAVLVLVEALNQQRVYWFPDTEAGMARLRVKMLEMAKEIHQASEGEGVGIDELNAYRWQPGTVLPDDYKNCLLDCRDIAPHLVMDE